MGKQHPWATRPLAACSRPARWFPLRPSDTGVSDVVSTSSPLLGLLCSQLQSMQGMDWPKPPPACCLSASGVPRAKSYCESLSLSSSRLNPGSVNLTLVEIFRKWADTVSCSVTLGHEEAAGTLLRL